MSELLSVCSVKNPCSFRHSAFSIQDLNANEEVRLFNSYHNNGSALSRDKIVNAHLKTVIKIADNKYKNYRISANDLIQEGTLGIFEAIEKFDLSMGFRFVTYAYHYINKYMSDYLIKNFKIVRFVTTANHKKAFFNVRSLAPDPEKLTRRQAINIAKELNIKEKDVLMVHSQMTNHNYQATHPNGECITDLSSPYFLDASKANPENIIEELIDKSIYKDALHIAISTLDPGSKRIIEKRWLNEEKTTLSILGDELGVSAEVARRMQNKAIETLSLVLEKLLRPRTAY